MPKGRKRTGGAGYKRAGGGGQKKMAKGESRARRTGEGGRGGKRESGGYGRAGGDGQEKIARGEGARRGRMQGREHVMATGISHEGMAGRRHRKMMHEGQAQRMAKRQKRIDKGKAALGAELF